MAMNPASIWWVACGLLVAVELATGTFYLLMLALACAAAALSALLGMGSAVQMMTAAVVGGIAVATLRRVRNSRPGRLPAKSNPDVNMDIGQSVLVKHWAADGSTQVQYRGALWQARYQGNGTPPAGHYFIRAVEGSCLMLDV
ncbi:NfeD family protein [Roseateles sp. GG27B]